jgi:hypothetical protein
LPVRALRPPIQDRPTLSPIVAGRQERWIGGPSQHTAREAPCRTLRHAVPGHLWREGVNLNNRFSKRNLSLSVKINGFSSWRGRRSRSRPVPPIPVTRSGPSFQTLQPNAAGPGLRRPARRTGGCMHNMFRPCIRQRASAASRHPLAPHKTPCDRPAGEDGDTPMAEIACLDGLRSRSPFPPGTRSVVDRTLPLHPLVRRDGFTRPGEFMVVCPLGPKIPTGAQGRTLGAR